MYGLTERVSLVITGPDVEAALTRARWVAHGLGFGEPIQLTTLITEQRTETKSEVWSDLSHEEAVRWIQRETFSSGLLPAARIS